MKKYEISISCRPNYVRMYKLNDEEIEQVEENELLEDAFEEIDDERGCEYDFEEELICVDSHYYLTVNEEGNDEKIVEITSLRDVPIRPCGDEELEGADDYSESPLYHFDGLEDGKYLISNTLMKGSCWDGVIELEDEEEFDATRLYYLRDDYINDELLGDDCAPVNQIYYRRGEVCDPEVDVVELDFQSDNGGYGDDYYLMSLSEKDWWEEERTDD